MFKVLVKNVMHLIPCFNCNIDSLVGEYMSYVELRRELLTSQMKLSCNVTAV